MTKRTLNKSMFNPKESAIYWKVYVVFIVSTSFKNEELFRVDLDSTKPSQKMSFAQEALIGIGIDGVNENKTLNEIFEKLIFSVRNVCLTLAIMYYLKTYIFIISSYFLPLPLIITFLLYTQENESHRHALSSLRKQKDQIRCLMHRIPSPSSNPLFIEVRENACMYYIGRCFFIYS